MLITLLFLMISLPSAQSDSLTFRVESVEVQTIYDSRYILERASAILPPDKEVKKSDVECLVSELKASGIFKEVNAELLPTGPNTRKLLLGCIYQSQLDRAVISDVVLLGFPYLDRRMFEAELNKRGLRAGTPFLKYYFRSIEDRINSSVRAALPRDQARKFSGWTWLTIRPDGTGNVRILVSSEYKGCENVPN